MTPDAIPPAALEIARRYVPDQFAWGIGESGTIHFRDKREALAREIAEYGERCAKPTPLAIPLPCPECEHAPSIKITVDPGLRPHGSAVSASIVCRDVEHQGKEWPIATALLGNGTNTLKCLTMVIEQWNLYVEGSKKAT